LIAGGGTGGHAIPALCVADSLSARGATVEFIGSKSGIERELVPRAGYPLHPLPLAGLAGGPLARARAATLFAKAISRCRALMRALRPGAVLGVGGYASAPAVFAARTLGIPTFLHEQNSVPGRVNRLAARFTREALATFPEATGHLVDAAWVGMPTRREFFPSSRKGAREGALGRLGLDPPVVLIFGGSGGALRINLAAAEAFGAATPYTVVQISGRRDFQRLSTDNPAHVILEYVENIWDYLAAAEVVVIRAGAGSLFDTAAAGRAAIVVPYPHATADHQLHNALYFTQKGAAELLLDKEVSAETLRGRIEGLLADEERREGLARSIQTLATPGAADEVAGRLIRAATGETEEVER
jgi:UDP-N-acetylglucosamine--N-acetylmuramyl-(pentapeptide) pyrophosphoryl-undecaprenol N-acetylglucosamine transferase